MVTFRVASSQRWVSSFDYLRDIKPNVFHDKLVDILIFISIWLESGEDLVDFFLEQLLDTFKCCEAV